MNAKKIANTKPNFEDDLHKIKSIIMSKLAVICFMLTKFYLIKHSIYYAGAN